MPIIIKDFTWTQSDQFICINLPLKGTKARNLDVLNSTEYCKVSYAPFFFECWFSEQVVDEECSAIVSNGVISLKFNKMFERTWPELFHSEFQNKELLKTIRENAIVSKICSILSSSLSNFIQCPIRLVHRWFNLW